jgi:hypothetical protein
MFKPLGLVEMLAISMFFFPFFIFVNRCLEVEVLPALYLVAFCHWYLLSDVLPRF